MNGYYAISFNNSLEFRIFVLKMLFLYIYVQPGSEKEKTNEEK